MLMVGFARNVHNTDPKRGGNDEAEDTNGR